MAYQIGKPLDYDPWSQDEDVIDSPSRYQVGDPVDFDPFRDQPQSSNTDEPDDGGHSLWDIPRLMGKGAAGVAKTASMVTSILDPAAWSRRGMEVVGDLTQNEALQSMADYSEKHGLSARLQRYGDVAEDYYDENLTAATKKSMEKTILASADEEGLLGEGIKDPWKIGGMIAESIPSTVLSMGGGALITKGLIQTGLKSAPKIVRGVVQSMVKKYGVPAVAGVIGGAVGEGTYSGLENANQAYEEMYSLPQEKMAQSKTYQEIFNSLPARLTDDQKHEYARRILSTATAGFIGTVTAVTTGILGAPSGAFMGKLIGGEAGKSFWGNMLKGALVEGLAEEMPQSGVERLVTNFTKKFLVDPNQAITEGVGEAMAAGAITGMAMGGGMAVVAGREGAGEAAKPESEAKKIVTGGADVTAKDILLGETEAERIRRAVSGKEFRGAESIEAEEEAAEIPEEELKKIQTPKIQKGVPDDRAGREKPIPSKVPQRKEPIAPVKLPKGKAAAAPGRVLQKPKQDEIKAVEAKKQKQFDNLVKNLTPRQKSAAQDLIDDTKMPISERLGLLQAELATQKLKERRAEPDRPPWDAHFRALITDAKKQKLADFARTGALRIKAGDPAILDLARRMGKSIEPDTDMQDALKTVHSRIKAGMQPRKRAQEMSENELRKALTTDYLTGLGSKHAFEIEDKRKKHVASIDLDSLKYFNDAFGHQTGDEMLINFGNALKDIGADAYHISGDEYVIQHDDEGELKRILDETVTKNLKANPITITFPDGKKIDYEVQFSYGTGQTIAESEEGLAAHKALRESTGLRTGRGEVPRGILENLAEGLPPGDKRQVIPEEGIVDLVTPAPAPKPAPKPAAPPKPTMPAAAPEKYKVFWESDYSEMTSLGAIERAIKAFRKDQRETTRNTISNFWRNNIALLPELPLDIQQQFVDKWNKITGHVVTIKDLGTGPLTNQWGEDWDEYMADKGPAYKPLWNPGDYIRGQIQADHPLNGETVQGALYIDEDKELSVSLDPEYGIPDIKFEFLVNISAGERKPTPQEQIAAASKEVDTDPTEAQKEAGNYKKGHLYNFLGFDITLENPKGSTREGTDPGGQKWSQKMANHYGYFKRTEGKDGDQIDVFIGDDLESDKFYVVDQIDPGTGKFDEHKALIGFRSPEDARKGYLANYEKGWAGLGALNYMTRPKFEAWIAKGRQVKPVGKLKPPPKPERPAATAPAAEKPPTIPERKELDVKLGHRISIFTPGNMKGYLANYSVVESGDLITSHDATTFQKNEDYPEGIQERTYHSDPLEQQKVVTNAQHLAPSILLSDDPTPTNGPPMITKTGVVLGGNSRAMSLTRAYKGKGANQYKEMLGNQARRYGFSPKDIRAMDKPVLVRVVALDTQDVKTLHRIASEFNKSLTQGMSEEAAVASMGKNISAETIEKVGLRLANRNLTLRELLGKKDGGEILTWLINDDVISPTDRGNFIDTKTTLLNPMGKRLIEKAIFGSIIDDPDLISNAPKSLQNKIERMLPSLARIKARGDQWDITPDIRDGLELATSAKAADLSIREHMAQGALFGDKKQYSEIAVVMADVLMTQKPNELSANMSKFAGHAMADVKRQGFLFPPVPFTQAFEESFGQIVKEPAPAPPEKEKSTGELVQLSQAEFLTYLQDRVRKTGDDIGIKYTETVEIEETGDTVEREIEAVAYLNDIDDEITGYEALLDCLAGRGK